MSSGKIIFSLTNFILVLLFIFLRTSVIADHGGFIATFWVTDVVDDGANNIEVESRNSDTLFTEKHDVDITITIGFDKAVEKPEPTDFETYFFDQYDEILRYDEILENGTIRKKELPKPEQLFSSNMKINSKHYRVTIGADKIPIKATAIILRLKKDGVKSVERADIEAEIFGEITSVPSNESNAIILNLVKKEPDPPGHIPSVVSITRQGFLTAGILDSFTVKIVLTEEPKAFTPAHIDITNARIDSMILYGTSTDSGATGRDGKFYHYHLVITPDLHDTNEIVIKVKEFEDTVNPPNKYIPSKIPVEGETQLTVSVSPSVTLKPPAKSAGFSVALPHNDGVSIPVNGFYILTKNSENSGIDVPPIEEGPTHRKPRQVFYNVRENSDLPNLETFLINGGTIDLVGPVHIRPDSVIISEIMWGSDRNLGHSAESQWIELHNTTDTRITIEKDTWFLYFYGANEPVPPPKKYGIIDRIGTLDATNNAHAAMNWWSIAGKGQSGHIGTRLIQPLISMERIVYTTGKAADGTKASSWRAAVRPSVNFDFERAGLPIGTPGAINLTPIPEPVISVPLETLEDTTVSIAAKPDIIISEIMYQMNRAKLPQWIELHNRSNRRVNLEGWEVKIENSPEDEDVFKTNLTFTLDETLVGAGQTALLVTEQGRNSGIGDDSDDLRRDRVVLLKPLLGTRTIRYRLLSNTAFRITLTPPSGSSPIDTAGNLGANPLWKLPTPTQEGEFRSSIIRNYGSRKNNGATASGWRLASSQAFLFAQHSTYYGHRSDRGTPGYRAGTPLPVQLSSFHPRRIETSKVLITWTTESELDNAGFNILRSEDKNGAFKIVNTALIQGAGTSSERHEYRFTDTTAKPNVIYYYRIEEVSFAGIRRTLATVRLKGHISVSDKLTGTWGNLKTQN